MSARSLALLADRQEGKLKTAAALVPLRQEILARITDRGDRGPLPVDAAAHLHNVRQVMPEGGIVALDNGI
jgi:acetolactate synthase-1/2/3 large subunit